MKFVSLYRKELKMAAFLRKDRLPPTFWPGWLGRAYELAQGQPTACGSPGAAISFRPVKRTAPCVGVRLREVLEAAGGSLASAVGEHEFRLAVDFRVLAAAFASGVPSPLRDLALEALCVSREYVAQGDAVLRHLLDRASRQQSSGALEAKLLEEHVGRLAASDSAVFQRWASAVRRAVDPLVRRADQLTPPGSVVVVDLGLLANSRNRARCKNAEYPSPRKVVGKDALAVEARWLLSCDSVRDGARRDGGVIVINLPAYLMVARALDRSILAADKVELPELGASKEQWFAAGVAWSNLLAEVTSGRWLSRYHPIARAAQMGWQLDYSIPLLALNAEAVEAAAGGRSFGDLPDVAIKTPSPRGRRAVVKLEYGGREIAVMRRRVPRPDKERLYFELPFTPPADYAARPYHRVVWQGRGLWWLHDIHAMADAGCAGAAEFAVFARKADISLAGDQFTLALSHQTTLRRAGEVHAGLKRRMGPFTAYEAARVKDAFVHREPGPLPRGFWEVLTASLPGRTVRGVKRYAHGLILAQARTMTRKGFKSSSWWPGGSLGQAILSRVW